MPLFHLMRNPSRGRERAVRHSSNGASLFSRALRVSQIQFPRYYFYDNRAPFNCYPRVYLLFSRHLSNSVHQVNVWYAVCLLHSCGVVSHIPTSRRISTSVQGCPSTMSANIFASRARLRRDSELPVLSLLSPNSIRIRTHVRLRHARNAHISPITSARGTWSELKIS